MSDAFNTDDRAAGPGYGLVIDLQGLQSVDHGDRGIGRVVVEYTRAMLAYPGLVRGLLLNPLLPFPGNLPPDLLPCPLIDWSTAASFRRAGAGGPIAYQILSPFELRHPVETVVPPHVMRPDVPVVVTVYDLIPLVMPETYLRDPDTARRYHHRLD